ncbi:MAG: leucine-rich repeat domain-containing protein [Oscillospiraceae bacterium]|jgi:hypothetical protein|nr:leucine-rich repeat domain-containing protein [Oscillospiraceae bacterium]
MKSQRTRRAALPPALLLLLLLLPSCGFFGREKSGNLEFMLDEETDAYTLAYYTDTSKVRELVIPDTFRGKPVTAIGRLAVSSADTLEKIVIGKNITAIDSWGIVDCRYLKAIEVAGDNPAFRSLDGVLYTRDGTRLITYPNAHTAAYSSSGKLLRKASYAVAPGTKVVGHCAFYKCYGLEAVELPDSVEIIEERAFHKCDALAAIQFPEGLTSIGKDAFLGCESLTSITLPSSIREIGTFAFYNAKNLRTISIGAAEADVTLGDKWYPTAAGRKIPVDIIWANGQ